MKMLDVGTGTAVLCLHGAPSPSSDFEPLIAALRGRHRVLVPDFPGYNGSPAPENVNLILAGQDQLVAELARRGVREVVVVGFSLGAYRAFHLALRSPVRVLGVVSLGGFAGFSAQEREVRRQAPKAVAKLDAAQFRGMLVEQLLSPAYVTEHPEVVDTISGWAAVVSMENVVREFSEVPELEDLRPALAGLRVPVVARVGELDVALPPAKSQEIAAAVPGARCEIVPGAAHALFLQDREGTLASILTLLSEAVGRP